MIEKRDGREVQYDPEKIKTAVLKAFMAVDKKVSPYALEKADNIADYVTQIYNEKLKLGVNLTVEETQDLVEHGLMACKRKDVARAYITYRNQRTAERERKNKTMQIAKQNLTNGNDDKQNANVDAHSFGGRVGEAISAVTKQIALDEYVSPTARYNHLHNIVYIHDLDAYVVGSHNCLTIPFDDLLANGFNTRQTDVRPANSINTAFQLVAVIFQLQSLQQFGGVSASHLDWTMVPYVRKSFYKHFMDGRKWITAATQGDMEMYMHSSYKNEGWKEFFKDEPIDSDRYKEDPFAYRYAMEMTQRETQQAVEGMYHNLNTLQSRSGNQLPFTSINYGTCTLPEGRMVIKALLEGSLKGVGKFHRTSIFPCGIFQLGKGINRKPGDPNYDLFRLALKSTAQRIYPNYANIDWSGNAGYDKNDPKTYFSTMGCRTANGWDINGLGQQKDGRGNICPVTIILPTVAMLAQEEVMESNGDPTEEKIVNKFMELLDHYIHDAKDSLIERFEWICCQNPASAKFMYENHTMAGYDGKDIRSALKHGTLAVG